MATINNTTTCFEDIHRDITQTHILPLLDGPSLSKASSVSSFLRFLCSDHNLWSHVSKSTWPSITTDPRVDHVISTFPSRYRSFYNDSYPSLITDVKHNHLSYTCSTSNKDTSSSYYNLNTSCRKLISAVDIRYQDAIIYSHVKVTEDMYANNMSSELEIQLPGISQTIELTVDEIRGADKATLLHVKESFKLNWILIDHALKRAGNFSSIKPVIKEDWASNETHVRYVTILPGRVPNEIVKCRIHVALGVGERGEGLYAKGVTLKLEDLDRKCLNGSDFSVVIRKAIMEENYVKRKVIVDDEERFRSYKVFKELKKAKKEWLKKKEQKRELIMNLSYFGAFFSFLVLFYFLTVKCIS